MFKHGLYRQTLGYLRRYFFHLQHIKRDGETASSSWFWIRSLSTKNEDPKQLVWYSAIKYISLRRNYTGEP